MTLPFGPTRQRNVRVWLTARPASPIKARVNDKDHIDDGCQAILDWLDAPARMNSMRSEIETAAPGIFSNAEKNAIIDRLGFWAPLPRQEEV